MNNELIRALIEFKQAYYNLLVEWSKNDSLSVIESVGEYPFHKSFDELNEDNWVDQAITELTEK